MPFLILKLKRQLKLISEYKHRDYVGQHILRVTNAKPFTPRLETRGSDSIDLALAF